MWTCTQHNVSQLNLPLKKLKNAAKGMNSSKRVQWESYGEALTSDEVFERLKPDKESHKRPSKKERLQSLPPVTEETGTSPPASESELE